MNSRSIFTFLLLFLATVFPHTSMAVVEGKTQQEEFAIPDIPSDLFDALRYKNDYFSFGSGLAVLADFTDFSQDDASREQVGVQEDDLEFRSLRLIFGGTLDVLGPVSYLLAAEYKGFNRDHDDPLFNLTDLSFTWKFRGREDHITIGKQKEPHIYEMVGNASNLPHHERFLEPFFRARNLGARYSTNFLDGRLGFAAGWYNDWLNDSGNFSENSNQFTARLSGLPLLLDEGNQFLHLGVSSRYAEGENDILRYLGRPGSHVTSYYVDSGELAADHAWHVGLEALLQIRQFTVLGEYVRADVSMQEGSDDPTFTGWYVTTGYVIHGDLRPYDKNMNFSRRVHPHTTLGALEPIVRYGEVDLDDAGIEGGKMKKWYVGLNWWATRSWKVSIGYGDIDLNRFGTTGNTEQILVRLQWIGGL